MTSDGERVVATADGIAALGDFEPLPTGDALRDHVMDRLRAGERKVLEIVCGAHPQWVTRELI